MGDDDDDRTSLDQFEQLPVTERSGGVRFAVHVRPKSSRCAILGVRDTNLEVALRAAPADNEANTELLGLLAKALDVRKGDVSIVSGLSSRSKLVAVNGIAAADVRTRIGRAKR